MGLISGSGRSPEEGMATHFSIFAWRTPRTEEPGRLQSQGCKEWDVTEARTHTYVKLNHFSVQHELKQL